MLGIERDKGESVVLALPDGGIIKILIRRRSGRRVYLGISAPDNVLVLREEFIKQGEDDEQTTDA